MIVELMTRDTRSDEHVPVAPAWVCGTCSGPWPCAPRRELLLAEYRGDWGALSVYLGSCLATACEDLPDVPGTVLRDRFLGWLPRARRERWIGRRER